MSSLRYLHGEYFRPNENQVPSSVVAESSAKYTQPIPAEAVPRHDVISRTIMVKDIGNAENQDKQMCIISNFLKQIDLRHEKIRQLENVISTGYCSVEHSCPSYERMTERSALKQYPVLKT